nr:hypothetical protein CFP56_74187 [Quercus suber]
MEGIWLYKEHGVPAQVAKYKIFFVHGLSACRHSPVILKSLPQEFIEELGLHILSFDKPSYGESGPHPKQTLKSLALDIEELVDQLELGSKFYVIGYSIGSHLVWGCLKYIPHRLAGVALLAPIINYWWAGGKVCLPNCLQRLTTNNYVRTSGQFELFITYHG